jgi:hypothetical protein
MTPLDEAEIRMILLQAVLGVGCPSSGKYSKRFLKNGTGFNEKNFQIPVENGSLEAVFEHLIFG